MERQTQVDETNVLALNAGSNSLKFEIVREPLAAGPSGTESYGRAREAAEYELK